MGDKRVGQALNALTIFESILVPLFIPPPLVVPPNGGMPERLVLVLIDYNGQAAMDVETTDQAFKLRFRLKW